MKPKRIMALLLVSVLILGTGIYLYAGIGILKVNTKKTDCCDEDKLTGAESDKADTSHRGCVFKTVFEGEYLDSDFVHATPENVRQSIDKALAWVIKEQMPDGGWYGGFHATQNILSDPNAKADPATTAMVAMAIHRCGSDPLKGQYAGQLKKATEFLLLAVESSNPDDLNITQIKGTQAQIKLGQNIDVMLTSQYLTNILGVYDEQSNEYKRIKNGLEKCVDKIQKAQNTNGSFNGAGWAGVLQSAIGNNALETAKAVGISVDTAVLEKSRNYQKANFSSDSKGVSTADGAGIVLYSVSGSSRASAWEANVAKTVIKKAKREGKIATDTVISVENLRKAGMSESEALKYNTAYSINDAASKMAQQSNVMNGFGSNGGEEFFSFLQTGEGLIISRDKSWKNWYTNVSGKLVQLQESNGNWRGHHCITSPVFCTATCLLILSVNNDIGRLLALSKQG